MDHIFETVKSVIRAVCGAEEMEEDSFLKEDLGLDSLSLVEVLAEIEDKLSIEFDSDFLNPDELLQVSDLVVLIRKTL